MKNTLVLFANLMHVKIHVITMVLVVNRKVLEVKKNLMQRVNAKKDGKDLIVEHDMSNMGSVRKQKMQ